MSYKTKKMHQGGTAVHTPAQQKQMFNQQQQTSAINEANQVRSQARQGNQNTQAQQQLPTLRAQPTNTAVGNNILAPRQVAARQQPVQVAGPTQQQPIPSPQQPTQTSVMPSPTQPPKQQVAPTGTVTAAPVRPRQRPPRPIQMVPATLQPPARPPRPTKPNVEKLMAADTPTQAAEFRRTAQPATMRQVPQSPRVKNMVNKVKRNATRVNPNASRPRTRRRR